MEYTMKNFLKDLVAAAVAATLISAPFAYYFGFMMQP